MTGWEAHVEPILAEVTGRYRAHAQYDDLLQTARLEVWRQVVARGEPAERYRQTGLIARVAQQAAIHFLRSPENEARRVSRRREPLPLRLSLWQLCGHWLEPREPDFAPVVVERLWRAWVWGAVWEQAGKEDRDLLRRLVRRGETYTAVSRDYGKPPNWSWRRLRKLLRPYAEQQ